MERLTRWVWEARDHEVIVLVYGVRFRLMKDEIDFTSGLDIDLVDKRTRQRVHNISELADYVRRSSSKNLSVVGEVLMPVCTAPLYDVTILFDFENAVWKQIRRQG